VTDEPPVKLCLGGSLPPFLARALAEGAGRLLTPAPEPEPEAAPKTRSGQVMSSLPEEAYLVRVAAPYWSQHGHPAGFTPPPTATPYQAEHAALHALDKAWGLLWEQGTGKTFAIIHDAAALFAAGHIRVMIVVAPAGVHLNWTREELPKHWPPSAPPVDAFEWDPQRTEQKGYVAVFRSWLDRLASKPGRAYVLALAYDGAATEAGNIAIRRALKAAGGLALYVADESQRIKTPGATRTKRIIAQGHLASHRRIASGTPAETPYDFYTQLRFLDPLFWIRELDVDTFTAFRSYFSEYEDAYGAGGRRYPSFKNYRRLDELQALLGKATSRVLKPEGLPAQTYGRVVHPMTNSQRRAYEELHTEAMTLLDSNELVTAELALTLALRLNQICAGHVRAVAGGEPFLFPGNPRGAALGDYLEDHARQPHLVWYAFQPDEAQVEEACARAALSMAFYRGDDDGRAIRSFKDGSVDVLAGNLSSGMAEGHTLVRAASGLYFSRTWRTIQRRQSEDRIHRIGQTEPVHYVDFVADRSPADERQLDCLRGKRATVDLVMGDPPEKARAWLRSAISGEGR